MITSLRPKRFTLSLDISEIKLLEKLAIKQKTSMAEILRRGLVQQKQKRGFFK